MPANEVFNNFFTIFFLVFGSLLGSFSNVIVLRMATGKSVIFPPSACPKCNHKLHAHDLIPVLSWLFLSGRCRYCQVPISWQYPLVEALMAVIICFSFIKTGLNSSFIGLASSLAIWFIASVIFIRNEVKKFQPFLWAVLYFVALQYFLCNYSFDIYSILIPIIAAVVAGVASINKDERTYAFAWGALAFILSFSVLKIASPWFLLILLPISLLNMSIKSRSLALWFYFMTQLVAIATILASR